MIDLIVRLVPGYGYLPIVNVDGKEVYRGEFRLTPEAALKSCIAAAEEYDGYPC